MTFNSLVLGAIVGFVLGIPGVIAFTLDLYDLASWPVLHATVSSVGLGQAEYAYEVDGRRYTGTETVGRSPTIKPGDTIVVHYDPALPSQHRTMGLSSNLPFLGLGGAAAIVVAGLVASALLVLLMGWSLWKLNLTGGRRSGPRRRRRAR